jgi:hypothetical protein
MRSARMTSPPHLSPTAQAAKRNSRTPSKICRKAGSGARHIVRYVSTKGSQLVALPQLNFPPQNHAAIGPRIFRPGTIMHMNCPICAHPRGFNARVGVEGECRKRRVRPHVLRYLLRSV